MRTLLLLAVLSNFTMSIPSTADTSSISARFRSIQACTAKTTCIYASPECGCSDLWINKDQLLKFNKMIAATSPKQCPEMGTIPPCDYGRPKCVNGFCTAVCRIPYGLKFAAETENVVKDVEVGCGGYECGIRVGDQITYIDEVKFDFLHGFYEKETSGRAPFRVTLRRDGKVVKLTCPN